MAAAADKQTKSSKYDDYDFPTTAPEPQAGHPGHTTPEQDAKVEQLRSELEKMGYTERLDTLTLLRFLRARKFDVEAAKTMYVPPGLMHDYSDLELILWPGSSTARNGERSSVPTT